MTAGQREGKHRKSIKLLVKPSGSFNAHSFNHRCDLAARCAIEAVSNGFQWLSVEQIEKPARSQKDAQFARQIAIRIMAFDLQIEQRHIARMQGRQRTSIHFALQTVEERMEEPVFAVVYEGMAANAQAAYANKLERMAA